MAQNRSVFGKIGVTGVRMVQPDLQREERPGPIYLPMWKLLRPQAC